MIGSAGTAAERMKDDKKETKLKYLWIEKRKEKTVDKTKAGKNQLKNKI